MRDLEIKIEKTPLGYDEALEAQMERVKRILENPKAPYALTFMEHHPVLTTGRTYDPSHLVMSEDALKEKGVSVVEVSRGGSITYHGPGQLTVYLHVHLKELGLGLTTLMRDLEQWVIDALNSLGVESGREEGKTGVWTSKGKICAMGVAAKKFVTYHGIGLNVSVDREAFGWIVPCGLTEPVDSLDQHDQKKASLAEVIDALVEHLPSWLAQLERRGVEP